MAAGDGVSESVCSDSVAAEAAERRAAVKSSDVETL